MSDLVSILVALAGRRARLFSISECISKREGARGIEEGGRQMGRICTRSKRTPGRDRLDHLYISSEIAAGCDRVVRVISSLLAFHHVQQRLLQPE